MTYFEKVAEFSVLVQAEFTARLVMEFSYPGVEAGGNVTVIHGTKYTRVDVGSSGKYMVDAAGNIFGIKAYGVINRRRQYGTLDTTAEWYWGGYAPVKRVSPGRLT